ncbi:hypothetical protein IAR50_004221 [Cryptococcus sp. DSM 104548]
MTGINDAMDIDSPVASTSNQASHLITPVAPFPSHVPSTSLFAQSNASSPAPAPRQSMTLVQNGQAARIPRTGYIYDPLMMLHCMEGYIPTAEDVKDAGEGHPEDPMRIKRIFTRLVENGLIRRMKRLEFQQVRFDQVMLVHSEEMWDKVQATEHLGDEEAIELREYYEQLSLYVCPETAHCARLSAGGVIQACRSVCSGEVKNAFAIVRPPGHHAEPNEHMGFCFFNNVAVATREMQREGLAKKVLILDWDVHHGNGTQRAFYEDGDVLYMSLHRHEGGTFYPNSDFGSLNMVGTGAGLGKSVNVPWPGPGFGDGDYIYAFQRIIMPIAYEFDPDLVIISAGFDAAEGDSLGQCHVSPTAYGHMTHMLSSLAGGKLVVALEGGYNLHAISNSALAVTRVLLGEIPPALGKVPKASEAATEVVWQVAKEQSKYWKTIDVKACEPPELHTTAEGTPAVYNIADLLKVHRAHWMFERHNLYQVPLASPDLEAAFSGQVICNEGVYEAGRKGVLVVFAHDFGNLRVEIEGARSTNVHMTNSYLLDTTDALVSWVQRQGYNLIDINVLRQLPTTYPAGPQMISKKGAKLETTLLKYVWDNYIELSEAEKVVFIGHGSACHALMDLVNERMVETKVKAVIQVAGLHSLVRPTPSDLDKLKWFKSINQIYVPAEHVLLDDEKVKRRLGDAVFTSQKAKVVDVLNESLPQIKQFVHEKLGDMAEVEVPSASGAGEGSGPGLGLTNGANGHPAE